MNREVAQTLLGVSVGVFIFALLAPWFIKLYTFYIFLVDRIVIGKGKK